MNKKQYNNVIENTLKYEQSAQTDDSLLVARAIFNNMGVALPQGDIKAVCETLKTDDYMGWKSCTMQEAQAAADRGVAAIGISEDKIVVLSANDEEQPVTQTASVMTLSENTSAYAVQGMRYYSYSYGTTTDLQNATTVSPVMDKPYDPHYPYMLNGRPNDISESQYYTLLDGYSYELRNDIVLEFTFDEIDSFRSFLIASRYKSSTQQEREEVVQDIMAIANEVISLIPGFIPEGYWLGEWLSAILDGIGITSTANGLNQDSVQDDIHDITDCVEAFSHIIQGSSSLPKSSNVKYTISLLKKSPLHGREIKIESSDGCKDIYTLENAAYELALMTAIANAHSYSIYKVAPEWSYFWEE